MSKWQTALDRLTAYEPKALGCGKYESEGLQCAISVVLPSAAKLGASSMAIGRIIRGALLRGTMTGAIRHEARIIGLDVTDLHNLQVTNDMPAMSPEQRYAQVLTWVTEQAEKERVNG